MLTQIFQCDCIPVTISIRRCSCILFVLILSLLILISSQASAQEMALPKADKNGDYMIRGYPWWQVVDEDPAGLNGRLSMDHPFQWFSPGCGYENDKIYNWPVIRRFRKGTILPADLSPAGFCISMDDRGKPWVRVSIDTESGGIICYVRANKNFIRPVNRPKKLSRLTYKLAELLPGSGKDLIRVKPDSKSSPIRNEAEKADKFIVISSGDGWAKIFTMSGQYGYIQTNKIKVIKNIVMGAAKVVKKGKMRKYPIAGHVVTGTVIPGKTVFLVSAMAGEVNFMGKYKEIDDTESWIRVLSDDGAYGFVNPENLEWIPME